MAPKNSLFYIFLTLGIAQSSYSEELHQSTPLDIETIATNLSVPWGMALLPDNTLLISQRSGILSQLNLDTKAVTTIKGLPAIKVKGQGGLFDVVLSPHYKSTGWIYFSYTRDISGQGATTLSRAKLNNSALHDWQDLLVTKSTTSTNIHFGGRISFDNSDHVFLSVGERGVRTNSQDLSNHAGSILRLNLDGTVPTNNPFIKDNSALSEIWSYGHRNPQGLFFNHKTQQLWATEHGPRGGDEINLIKAGRNYGWPIISYGMEYNQNIAVGQSTARNGMEQPIKVYIPSIAPSGLIQYSGKAFPEWQNNLLTGSLKLRHLNRIILNKDNHVIDEIRLLKSINGRIRNLLEAPNGWLYISTDDGRILKIKPKLVTYSKKLKK